MNLYSYGNRDSSLILYQSNEETVSHPVTKKREDVWLIL